MSIKFYRENVLPNISKKIKHPFTVIFVLGVKKDSKAIYGFVGGIEREKEYANPGSVTYEGLIADIKGFGFHLEEMSFIFSYKNRSEQIVIKSDKHVNGMVLEARNRGSVRLDVEGRFESEPSNAECLEAMASRREMRDGRIGHDGSVDGAKTGSMENKKKKDKEMIGEPANQNDILQSICQKGEGDEHYESTWKATTQVEDQRGLSSEKKDRTVETDRVPAKTGRGSATRCASNPGRDPAERGRGRGIASSSRNSKGLRFGRDAASTLGKGLASNSRGEIVSSSRRSATSSLGRARGSASGKGTKLSSGRGVTLSSGRSSSSRLDTTKMGTASSPGRGITSSSPSSVTLSTGRGRGSTSGKGTTVSSGRDTNLSLGRGTTRTGTNLRSGMDKGSSSAKAEPQTSRSQEEQ